MAKKVSGVVITWSPGCTCSAAYAVCRAAVPEVTETACSTPARSAIAASNRSTSGPVVSQSLRSAASTAAMSSDSMD